MIDPQNKVLRRMLDRLINGLVNGPAMNCQKLGRQRVDVATLGTWCDVEPGSVVLGLLGPDGRRKLDVRDPAPPAKPGPAVPDGSDSPADKTPFVGNRRRGTSSDLLRTLRLINDQAQTYERDTGTWILNVGFPLLRLPPGMLGKGTEKGKLAPVAFVPIKVRIADRLKRSIEFSCATNGSERVVPNLALRAWLENQGGKLPEAVDDEEPWREIAGLVRAVADRVGVGVPPTFAADVPPAMLDLTPVAGAASAGTGLEIVCGAVFGLFPATNQGLLTDMRAMVETGSPDGPITAFVDHGLDTAPTTDVEAAAAAPAAATTAPRAFDAERLVLPSDPSQTRAVRLSRRADRLVIHGPPGTGKSQTIANVIGNHLAHGERVLFVCDKRTAIDVVAERLTRLDLGDLCAVIHDPQRDQRALYKSVRDQLDGLGGLAHDPAAAKAVEQVDAELQRVHAGLTSYYRDLMGAPDGRPPGGSNSFHELFGQWLDTPADADGSDTAVDVVSLQGLGRTLFRRQEQRFKEALTRGGRTAYATNPWWKAAGVSSGRYLSEQQGVHRDRLARCVDATAAADATADTAHPPFDVAAADADLTAEARRRQDVAARLAVLGKLPPTAGPYWAGRKAEDVAAARADLSAAAAWVGEVKSGPMDPQPASSVRTADELAADRQAMETYLGLFDHRSATFQATRAAVPTADDATILRWMAAEPKAVASAGRRLDAAAATATAAAANPLDASLLARYVAAPLDAGKLVEALAALNAYLDVARSWTVVFHGAEKRAAAPVVRPFGLSLNVASADRVTTFLSGVQQRADIRAAMTIVLGEPFESPADDPDAALVTFAAHRGVLTALSRPAGPVVAGPLVKDADTVRALNDQIGPPAVDAASVVSRFGQRLGPAAAVAVVTVLAGLESRVRLAELIGKLSDVAAAADTPDAELLRLADVFGRLFDLLTEDPITTPVGRAIGRALADPAAAPGVAAALRRSPTRAAAALEAEGAFRDAGLFSPAFLRRVREALRSDKLVAKTTVQLADQIGTLEDVIRTKELTAELPPALAKATADLLKFGTSAGAGFAAVRRHVLAGEVKRRLDAAPDLNAQDNHRLQAAFERYRALSDEKRDRVLKMIRSRWTAKQKSRLLAVGGNRPNALSMELARRLILQGKRALRLRQVIELGAKADGGDPLFDLRPVWMASPEAVAQLFPRQPIFDVVIFDEASQCRVEEALPVLTRAKRVVVAGDQQQLPPTRFFDALFGDDGDDADGEPDTDAEQFTAAQSGAEDLLTAALQLEVEPSHLDVHYRSRDADLIGFSNEYFYGNKLQPLPGNPNRRQDGPPITLRQVDGTYGAGKNPDEAAAVVDLVRDLLGRPNPPSVGIACFGAKQQTLVNEALNDAAEEDDAFAELLARAKDRQGENSSEGLFVKNLENVQGEERDHIIVSTTYGPDKAGQFRRNFGPLGRAEGGRRLNVLVTRAREAMHLVTSFPRAEYAAPPERAAGQILTGTDLLLRYMAFAERLRQEHEQNQRVVLTSSGASTGVLVKGTVTRSAFAEALGRRLAADHNVSTDVYWGNDGFGVDLAVLDPSRPPGVTVGVLCDLTRYAGSDDPVEWDAFRTAVHERQGWRLLRVWSPHFFRDPTGGTAAIAAAAGGGMSVRP